MTLYRPLIEQMAKQYELDPNLVEAVVLKESSGETDAFRFESGYFERYLRTKPEYAGQNRRRISSSYGLMQVMYPTAKQYGFQGPPEALFVPETGMRFGCQHLAALIKWAAGNIRQALAAYNGGQGGWKAPDPQAYATKVLAILRTVEAEHPKGTL